MCPIMVLLNRPSDPAAWSYAWWVDVGLPLLIGVGTIGAAVAAAIAAFNAANAARSANSLSRSHYEAGVAREDLLARRRFGSALFRETSDAVSRAAFGLADDDDLRAVRKSRIAHEGELPAGITDALQQDCRATTAKWRRVPKPFDPDVENMAEMLADLQQIKAWITLWQEDPAGYVSLSARRAALDRAVARLSEEADAPQQEATSDVQTARPTM